MTALFTVTHGLRLCLASGSPRRRDLLAATGLEFFVLNTAFPETQPRSGEEPIAYALSMASAKAASARSSINQSSDPSMPTAILACDTIVCLENRIFGKPASRADLLDILRLLNGRAHDAITAVCIGLPDGTELRFAETTSVHFEDWPDSVLEAYASVYAPYDKAGGYGIQDGGGFLVSKIIGSWSNVVGLPLSQLLRVLLDARVIHPARRDAV